VPAGVAAYVRRRVGTRCRPRTKANRSHRACTLLTTARTVRKAVPAGRTTIRFTGKGLRPGAYRATFVVTDAAGNASKPATVKFSVVRR